MGITVPRAFEEYVSLKVEELHLRRYVLILEDRTVDITVDDQTGHFTKFEIRLGSKAKQQVILKQWDRYAQVDTWRATTLPAYEIPVSHFTKLLTSYS